MDNRGIFEIESEPYEKALDEYQPEIREKINTIIDTIFNADSEHDDDGMSTLSDSAIAKTIPHENVTTWVVKTVRNGQITEVDWLRVLDGSE